MNRLYRDADRIIAVVLGVYFIYASIWLFDLWRSEPSYAFYDWLWPEVFFGAGLLDLAYALKPKNRHLFSWSGGFMIFALLSRACAIVAAWSTDSGSSLSTARTFFSFGTWSTLAFCVAAIWLLLRARGEGRRRSRT